MRHELRIIYQDANNLSNPVDLILYCTYEFDFRLILVIIQAKLKPQAIAKIGIPGAIWNPKQVLIKNADSERDFYLKPAGEDEVLRRISRG